MPHRHFSPRITRIRFSQSPPSRDAAARALAFAIPTRAAIELLTKAAGGRGLVELGAHNGYWARTLASAGVAVSAYDINPPEVAPRKSANLEGGLAEKGLAVKGLAKKGLPEVMVGSAESLRESTASVLLLCMPPPGDASCASDALDAFPGPLVAYVGEWATGMTADRFTLPHPPTLP